MCTARVVREACRSDSRVTELAEDSSIDAFTDARYSGAAAESTWPVPPVTAEQPTTTIAITAAPPSARAAIRAFAPTRPSTGTICRRYRFRKQLMGNFRSATPSDTEAARWVDDRRCHKHCQLLPPNKERKLTTEFVRQDLAQNSSTAAEPDRVRVIREELPPTFRISIPTRPRNGWSRSTNCWSDPVRRGPGT